MVEYLGTDTRGKSKKSDAIKFKVKLRVFKSNNDKQYLDNKNNLINAKCQLSILRLLILKNTFFMMWYFRIHWDFTENMYKIKIQKHI